MHWLKKNWLLIIGIIIVGAYSLAPQFLFVRELGDGYQGIYLSNTSDELYYHSRVQEFFDGHPGIGNAYIYEHKADPFLQPPLGEAIVFGLGKLTGTQGNTLALLAYKFLFPVFFFAILYLLFNLLSKGNSWLSFLFGLGVILATNLIVNPSDLLGLIDWHKFGNFNQIYSRPINPQISSLFFFSYLICLYLTLDRNRRIYSWLAVLFLGGAFYIYPYTWSFILVLNFILFIYYSFQKKAAEIKKILGITAGGLLISLPYWWLLWQAIQTEAFNYAANAQGMRLTHEFIFSKVALVSLLLFVVACLIDKKLLKQKPAQLIGTLIFTGWIVINQQILTGRELFHGHYHVFYNIPILLLTGFYLLHYFRNRPGKFIYNFATGLILLTILLNGVLTVQKITTRIFPQYISQQQYGVLVNWIQRKTKKDDVVVSTNMELNSLIPAYTRANILTAFPATWFLVPADELRQRYFVYLNLLGVEPTRESFVNYLEEHPIEPLSIGAVPLAEQDHNCPECITNEVIDQLVNKYQDFYQKNFISQLNQIRVDYVVVNNSQTTSITDEYFELVAKDVGNFFIYKVK